ncbi:hypothetical protein TIFTF001_045698, partial [Ficus carica]
MHRSDDEKRSTDLRKKRKSENLNGEKCNRITMKIAKDRAKNQGNIAGKSPCDVSAPDLRPPRRGFFNRRAPYLVRQKLVWLSQMLNLAGIGDRKRKQKLKETVAISRGSEKHTNFRDHDRTWESRIVDDEDRSNSSASLSLSKKLKAMATLAAAAARRAATLSRVSFPKAAANCIQRRGLAGAADHHGPPKVDFWKDPMSPSKWKEEH